MMKQKINKQPGSEVVAVNLHLMHLNASRPTGVSIKYKMTGMNLSQQNINKPWLHLKLHAL